MNINLTLFINMVFFGGFVWFCMNYVWPVILAQIEQRQKIVADGLAAAQEGADAHKKAEQEAATIVSDAKTQAAEIVTSAEKRGSLAVEQAADQAKQEKARILESAEAEIEQQTNTAREQLRGQVSSIAVAAASKIVDKEIDESAHADLLNDLVKQLKAG